MTTKTQQISKQWEDLLRVIPGYDPIETAGDCWFDEESAQMSLDFFSEHLVLIEGRTAGQPFKLELWQRGLIANLFGWKRPDGTRRYREAFVFVPRKNGKTPLCAGIINYVAFCDGEPGAQIYSAAAEREQAALVYRHSIGMINRNPMLSKRCRAYKTFKSIEFYGGDTVYKALSADADTKHGLNAHLVVVDELHIQPNRDLVDTLETATASRTQPLIIHITTAGVYDRESICWEKYDYACKVRDGLIDDPYTFPVIYEASCDDDWTSEETWHKANPNLGVSVSLDYLKEKCKEAQDIPAKENSFRRLHLNQWTEQDTRWLSMDKWHDCATEPFDLTGWDCFGGVDLSSTQDLTAFVELYTKDDKYVIVPNFFAPEAGARKREKSDRAPYVLWAKQGHMTLTKGETVDYAEVRRCVNSKSKNGLKMVGVDPWNATQFNGELIDDGFDVIEVRQGFSTLTAPSKMFEQLILDGKLKHFANPVMDWCMSNVGVDMDAAGNIKPSKKKSVEKIDGVAATINALAILLTQDRPKDSIYEERGVLAL